MSKLKDLVLRKRDEGKLVYLTHEGPVSVPIAQFVELPADGILYDLNRLEEVSLTFMDDIRWVNDFAAALTIRALKARVDAFLLIIGAADFLRQSAGTQDDDKMWVWRARYLKLIELLDALPEEMLAAARRALEGLSDDKSAG